MRTMIGGEKKLSLKHRRSISSRYALHIVWPLVLYSLIQIFASNLLQPNLQDQTLDHCHTRSTAVFLNQALSRTLPTQDQSSKCSSNLKISSETNLSYLKSLLRHILCGGGGRIVAVEALSLYQANQDKGIIILNSTNFNQELIQHKHPFPHVKLIEYYVSYSSFGTKFKSTYTELAKEIHSWRNVIRQSVIDLGVASNSPIANSWSIKIVPLLRIHPPPNPMLADRLNKRYSEWISKLSATELQRSMFDEYNSSRLMVEELDAKRYLANVSLLKSDILGYIERYVSERPNDQPTTWPNLAPVSDASLATLRKNHPRQELFLLIDGSSRTEQSKLGLKTMMELSSSAPWKAIRYVKASENTALIEDVIDVLQKQQVQQKKTSENLELLKSFLANKPTGGNNILLFHLDDSHSPTFEGTFMSLTDLITIEQSVSTDQQASRVKRASESLAQQPENMSNERKVELISLYVKQTYIETKEDREFVDAINSVSLDNSAKSTNDVSEKLISKFHQNSQNNAGQTSQDQSSLLNKFLHTINFPNKKGKSLLSNKSMSSSDYEDKLKAIRYMLFNEVPRASVVDKSLVEQQEQLNSLINLVTVIKTYFPLPDSSSIKFIEGVHDYLRKQQSRLLTINNRDQSTHVGFDTRAFKQELKRLESEDKRLPEIKDWKHCQNFGYPCAIWRLFHTLAAFEYRKLSQMNSQQASLRQAEPKTQIRSLSETPAGESTTVKSSDFLAPQPPVEHLVSPPSTTTSLSLTIATPTSHQAINPHNNNINKQLSTEADLPMPVILVMRDYVTSFFSCEECRKHFRTETADLSLERIRQQEPAEFSILWLWELHNRVNKRLSVDPETNPPDHPKVWFPTYDQCSACYRKAPSFLQDPSVDSVTIFHESIDWNRQEVLNFLLQEYTKQPMDNCTNLFGYRIPYAHIAIACTCCLILILLLRCTSYYVERQRRHKANLLNGNDTHYALAVHN